MDKVPELSNGIVNKLISARYSINLGQSELSHNAEITLITAINVIQDAVELFLLSIIEYLNVTLPKKSDFIDYLDKIDYSLTQSSTLSKILPKLPFRNELIALNKIRVSAKHYGLIPNRQECQKMLDTSQAFMQTVCESVFQIDFFSLSLTEKLEDGLVKNILQEAEQSFLKKDYATTLINCRKALYLEFERDYDIRQCSGLLSSYLCKAPYFAKNQDYIDKYVKDATDYIVIDYNTLNTDLIKYKINLLDFYEILRITPKIYEYSNKWIIKEDFNLFDEDFLQHNADYALIKTIEILLSTHAHKRTKQKTSDKYFVINLISETEIPVYTKPDSKSSIITYIPKNTSQIHSTYRIENLSGDFYLFVIDTINQKSIQGYISSEHEKNDID